MLGKMKEKVTLYAMKGRLAIYDAMTNERGDTNFISILIILGIVILLAGVFIGFKDEIVGQVQDIIDGFTIS